MEKNLKPVKGEVIPNSENQESKTIVISKPDEIKKTLEAQIKKYDHLNRLVNNRALFMQKKEQLNMYLNQIISETQSTDLETKVCKLVLSEPSNYRSSEGITISNSLIIEKAIRFIIDEIDLKLKSLETEILSIN